MWCSPCVTEMPSLERLHRQFQGRNFRILAISVDLAEIESVRAFVERHQYSFTVLHDPRQRTMDALRERRIPVTFVLNRSGKAIGQAIGLRDWSQPAVIRLFEELLKPSQGGASDESQGSHRWTRLAGYRSLSAFIRLAASASRSSLIVSDMRTYPSPHSPNPFPGVATIPASVRRKVANSADV
jgi:thiol-disulfide isomerase/thioredoxin